MPDRSLPIVSDGKQYHLRFSHADKKAVEMDFGGIGIIFLLQRERAGSTSFSSFLHRGLYEENKKGELVHVFTQDPIGNDQAGELLERYTSERSITVWLELREIFYRAFVISGICKDPTIKPKEEETTPKNETPPNQTE
jgi:hypothetical protein